MVVEVRSLAGGGKRCLCYEVLAKVTRSADRKDGEGAKSLGSLHRVAGACGQTIIGKWGNPEYLASSRCPG